MIIEQAIPYQPQDWFVDPQSIVRRIWGNSDVVLFIFAGAAAEFALNKSVDWLFHTGKLPSDPLGRLFTTVDYARQIVFAPHQAACQAIAMIVKIHNGVEQSRGFRIPDEAYKHVLYMLVAYSIAAYEMLEYPLSATDKEEVYAVFSEVGVRMRLSGLPASFKQWQQERETQLCKELQVSAFSHQLYLQYRKHLGRIRFEILQQVQSRLVPGEVSSLLQLKPSATLPWMLGGFRLLKRLHMAAPVRSLLLPSAYKKQILAINYN